VCPPFEAHIAQVDPSYFKSEIQSNNQNTMITSLAESMSALSPRRSARRSVRVTAQVFPLYFKRKTKKFQRKIMTALFAAFKSALLANSNASVSVWPPPAALKAQVPPRYVLSKIKSND
jgi:hypothetical protein